MTPTYPNGPRTKALSTLLNRQVAPITCSSQPPNRDFVIWFTARTGSTWLGSLLFSAGFPKPSEYFHPNKILRIASYLGVNTWADYVNSVKQKRTIDGVFAHEMTFQFWDMLRNDGDVMSHLDFSGPSIVLFREDVVAQAVSIYLAVKSKKWHRYQGTEITQNELQIPYNENEIREKILYICKQETGLKEHQNLLIPQAKFLSYEKMAASQPKSVIVSLEQQAEFKASNVDKARSYYVPVRSAISQGMCTQFMERNEQFVADIQSRRKWLLNNKDPLTFTQ